MVGQK